MSIVYQNLDKTNIFKELVVLCKNLSINLRDVLTPERIVKFQISSKVGLTFNYAAKIINEKIIATLQKLANEQQVIAKYKLILNGEIMNTGENRKVLHHLTRGQLEGDVISENKNLYQFYQEQQTRINQFASQIHSQQIKGSTGKTFQTVIQIGIGGSDLGPRALYIALKNYVQVSKGKLFLNARFISNVDPDDANEVLADIDYETTLFIIVSKSGTTQETLTNEELIRKNMKQKVPNIDPSKHIIAITSATSPMAKSPNYLQAFFMNDFIGGRFSSTSAVGGTVLTLAFGPEVFTQLLEGAHLSDLDALNPEITQNMSLMDALIGIWERNFLKFPVTAILPYSQALNRFPAHLQQCDMESNGKSVNRIGQALLYNTGPIIFGEPGTNGQHSFYQLLHQGTDVIPLQFIGFKLPQIPKDLQFQGSTSQQKLNANLVAQIVAFAKGKQNYNQNKNFLGNRPSSILYAEQLTPKILGALLAHYENKIMFQGFLWNLNSFDQEGVQLGKMLTNEVLLGKKDMDPCLQAYSSLLS